MADQQQQQQGNEPAKGSPEYNAAMAAKFENQGDQQNADPNSQSFTPQRPEHIPEKFWDAEKGTVRVDDLAKSYAELEKVRSAPKTPDPAAAPKADGKTDDSPAQQAVEKAGLDWDTLGDAILKEGDIPDTAYAELEKIGIPRDIAKAQVQAVKDAREMQLTRVRAHVGGEDQLNSMMQWAAANLDKGTIESYNAILATDRWADALDLIKGKMESSKPTAGEPSLLTGSESSAGTGGAFSSNYEMTEAMNKRNDRGQRLYDVDPAYRNSVRQRIIASNY